MIQYTTPTFTVRLKNVDLTTNWDIYVTLEQMDVKLTKSKSDLTVSAETVGQVTNTIIEVPLTQQESGAFEMDLSVDFQINAVNPQDKRAATGVITIDVMRNLLDEVITYGN